MLHFWENSEAALFKGWNRILFKEQITYNDSIETTYSGVIDLSDMHERLLKNNSDFLSTLERWCGLPLHIYDRY